MESNKTMKNVYSELKITVYEYTAADVLTTSELGTQWQDDWDTFSA